MLLAMAADLRIDVYKRQRQAQQRGHRDAEQQADLGRHAPHLERVAGRVGGAAEEGGVAERQQAGEAQQQVEGAGEQGIAHDLHGLSLIHIFL